MLCIKGISTNLKPTRFHGKPFNFCHYIGSRNGALMSFIVNIIKISLGNLYQLWLLAVFHLSLRKIILKMIISKASYQPLEPKFSDRHNEQTVQTHIRLPLEKSDQDLHCLLFHFHRLEVSRHGRTSECGFRVFSVVTGCLKIKELYGNLENSESSGCKSTVIKIDTNLNS